MLPCLVSRIVASVSHDTWHKISGGTAGAIGGFFGIPRLLVELPFSTTITMRAIASIAIVNTLFIDHFQNLAHGHFIVRRLERKYSYDIIYKEYGNSNIS